MIAQAMYRGGTTWTTVEDYSPKYIAIRYAAENPEPFGNDKNDVVWKSVLIRHEGVITKWSVGCEWIPDYTVFQDSEI